MKVSKGGIGLEDILGFDAVELNEWMDAAEELEKSIADSVKR